MKVSNQTNPASTPSSQTAETRGAAKTGKVHPAMREMQGVKNKTDSSSTAEISERGKEMSKAKQVANEAPDVREEKIAELKRRIAAGQYNVKPEAIADRMVDEHIATRDLA